MDAETRRWFERLDARFDQVQAEVGALQAQVAKGFGARDEHGRRLVHVLTEVSDGQGVKAGTFIERSQVPGAPFQQELAAALEACDIDSPKQLGRLLGLMAGKTINGVRVERTRDRCWRFVPVSAVMRAD